METAIWLTEVAPTLGKEGRRFLDQIDAASEGVNPGLARLALKLATGAGKTTVMAMIIAWQTINAVRRPGSRRFTRGFLVVTPGVTIRDRLRVLQPNESGQLLREPRAGAERQAARPGAGEDRRHQLPRVPAARDAAAVEGRTRPAAGAREPELRTKETEGQMLQPRHAGPDGHEAHPGPERRGAPLLPREAGRGGRRRPAQGRRPQGGRAEPRGGAGLDLRARSRPAEARPAARDRPLGHAVLPARLRATRRGRCSPGRQATSR